MSVYYVTDQTLSDEELWALTSKYFGDLGPGVVQGMFNIAKRESGGQAGIVNFNPDTRDDSHGLWQINIRPDANPKYIGLRLDDPEVNARVAREMYDASGPSPWSTYNPTTDAAMFNNGGGGPDQAGLGGMATTPRPLVPMSSVNAPTYGAPAAAAAPLVPPKSHVSWDLLKPLMWDALGSTGGNVNSPEGQLLTGILGNNGQDATAPLVPQPTGTQPLIQAPVMTAEDWKKKLMPAGLGA